MSLRYRSIAISGDRGDATTIPPEKWQIRDKLETRRFTSSLDGVRNGAQCDQCDEALSTYLYKISERGADQAGWSFDKIFNYTIWIVCHTITRIERYDVSAMSLKKARLQEKPKNHKLRRYQRCQHYG